MEQTSQEEQRSTQESQEEQQSTQESVGSAPVREKVGCTLHFSWLLFQEAFAPSDGTSESGRHL